MFEIETAYSTPESNKCTRCHGDKKIIMEIFGKEYKITCPRCWGFGTN